ncbi:MAG TPA: hypothetical protein VH458_19820, partial [Vicinamibacterales bacterium]
GELSSNVQRRQRDEQQDDGPGHQHADESYLIAGGVGSDPKMERGDLTWGLTPIVRADTAAEWAARP